MFGLKSGCYDFNEFEGIRLKSAHCAVHWFKSGIFVMQILSESSTCSLWYITVLFGFQFREDFAP